MVIIHSYVKLPEGNLCDHQPPGVMPRVNWQTIEHQGERGTD